MGVGYLTVSGSLLIKVAGLSSHVIVSTSGTAWLLLCI